MARGKKKEKQQKEISPDAQTYTGPLNSVMYSEQKDLHTVLMKGRKELSSTSGGVIAEVYGNDAFYNADFSSIAASFEECRVLGMSLEFHPTNRYNKTTTICKPAYVVVDRSSSGALTGYSAALNHGSCKIVSLEDFFIKTVKMSNAEESQFQICSTGSITAKSWIKIYVDGLSLSTVYGDLIFTYLIQFRGRA